MEFIAFVALAALTIIPLYKLLPQYGVNQWWALAAVVPLGVIVLLWVMASRSDRMGAR